MSRRAHTLIDFLNLVSTNGQNGCWTWTGRKDRDGYGIFGFEGKEQKAHRIMSKLAGNDPTGQCVCHKCDNPNCVNPTHLFLGSIQDNNRDKQVKGRVKGVRNSLAKLNDNAVREIRSSTLSSLDLAKKFGVGHATIWQVKVGRSWTHVV